VDVENGALFGVRLGETEVQVRQTLGRPDDVQRVPGLGIHWFYARFDLQMFFDPRAKRVDDLYTAKAGATTVGGVGVGSSKAQILQAFPLAFCVALEARPLVCNVGSGTSVTDFYLEAGRVTSIDINPESPLPTSLSPVVDVANGGIFGVRVGQSEGQVRRVLGRPDGAVEHRKKKALDWYYEERLNLSLHLEGRTKRVAYLDTSDPRAKTSNGLGVGSGEAEITAAYPGAVCTTNSRVRSCAVGGRSTTTVFFLKSGHAYLVEVLRA
jgi:hypothetical protein